MKIVKKIDIVGVIISVVGAGVEKDSAQHLNKVCTLTILASTSHNASHGNLEAICIMRRQRPTRVIGDVEMKGVKIVNAPGQADTQEIICISVLLIHAQSPANIRLWEHQK